MQKNKKAMLVIFLTVFIDLVGFGIIIPLNPYLAKKMGGDAFDVGLLMSVYSLMQFIFSPFWGRLSDKVGRRPIILLSLLGASLSHLLFAYGETLTLLFAARCLAGFFGANISTAMAYMADVTDSKERSAGMGMVGAAFGLGFVLGPFIGGVATHFGVALGSVPPLGESFPAVVASAICFFNFILAIFVLQESLPPEKRQQLTQRPSRWSQLKKFGQRPVLGKVMLTYFFLIFGMANMEASMFLLVKDKFNWSLMEASWGFAFVGIIIAFTQGYLFRKGVHVFGERHLLKFGIVAASIGLFAIGFSPSVAMLALAVLVMSVGSGLANPATTGMVSLLAEEQEQGFVMGANQSLAALGRILGPALGGWLYRDVGMASPFVAAAVLTAVPLLLLFKVSSQLPNSGQQRGEA